MTANHMTILAQFLEHLKFADFQHVERIDIERNLCVVLVEQVTACIPVRHRMVIERKVYMWVLDLFLAEK